MMSYTTIGRKFTARKEHVCHGCRQPITPGMEYIREAVPPWLDYDGDVDDEGRSIAYLKPEEDRRWYTMAFHTGCHEEYWYGY